MSRSWPRWLAVWLAACWPAAAVAAAKSAPVKLVVLVVIDQMRGDELDCERGPYRQGLARLCQEGRNFRQASLAHGLSETASGHATLATGVLPRQHGVLDKRLYHRPTASLRDVCAFAPAAQAGGNGSDGNGVATDFAAGGCNAGALLVRTLGERLRRQRPGAQVVAVAAKARSANLLAGTDASLVAWTHAGSGPRPSLRGRTGAAGPLPAWLTAAWAAAPAAQAFAGWSCTAEQNAADQVPAALSCDCGHGPQFPHLLAQGASAERAYDAWMASPQSDAAVVALALAARAQLHLGEGSGADLLLVSLAALDRLGHCFGPSGPERRAALLAVDEQVGSLLQHLRAAVPQGLVVALTADHGMMPRLDVAAAKGRRTGTLDTAEAQAALRDALGLAGGQGAGQRALTLRYPFVFLPPGPQKQARASAAAQALTALPAVWRAWSAQALLQDPHPVAQLMAASHHPERGGDVIVALRPYFRPTALTAQDAGPPCGARHGSPWRYDRRVPLVVWGDGVPPGQVDDGVNMVQLSRTLADWLGLPVPGGASAPLPWPGSLD